MLRPYAYCLLQVTMLAAAALAVFSMPANAACNLSDLKWLSGTWRFTEKDNFVEERWVVLPSGELIGSAWSAHPSRPTGSAEAETIADVGGTVTLRLRHFDLALARALEPTDAPMVFTAASCIDGKTVFDGQGDRAGEHITYVRSGAQLTFLGDFLHQGQPIHVEQSFVLAHESGPQP